MHTVEPPFARAMFSQAFFAIMEAEKRSLPSPIPETIWLLHTFANPQTRTQPVALQDHFVPPDVFGVEGVPLPLDVPLTLDGSASAELSSSPSPAPLSSVPSSASSGGSTGSGGGSSVDDALGLAVLTPGASDGSATGPSASASAFAPR